MEERIAKKGAISSIKEDDSSTLFNVDRDKSEDIYNQYLENQKAFLDELIDNKLSTQESVLPQIPPFLESSGLEQTLPEEIYLTKWKNIENISAQVIEINDDTVTLECLIDKDTRLYEEREFPLSIFKEFQLSEGKLFKLCFFERPCEVKMEIHDKPDLILDSDFPKIDFQTKFSNSKIFKENR